ncbi:MAG: alpha/beta hydrolase [Bryobacteraceae bacterium]
MYVGIEAEPPDDSEIQYYDAKTRRIETPERISGQEYRSDSSPKLTFILDSQISPIAEKRFVIDKGPGRIGTSMWHAPGAGRSSTIILIHGADEETRAMGFLIPYFVSHGLNVITYDQRGTGESTGNWRYQSRFQGR